VSISTRMNVLILTPDAVGSTLLQRLLTIYMQLHSFDRPVINLHEITNGLEKYYSPEFNQEIVSKKRVENWGYYQSLEEIVTLLSDVDHYKTSRLAQYHIKYRQDPIEKQIPFYQYLDNNFFIIACRRHNIFEHALSLSLNKITKKLNVYTHKEKINTFVDLYANKVQIDERVFIGHLNSYRDYIKWSTDHFNIGSFFYYDQHLLDIEQYILNLPVFSSQSHKVTWKEKFNIDFHDWNRMHHIPSNMGSLLTAPDTISKLLENKNNSILENQHSGQPVSQLISDCQLATVGNNSVGQLISNNLSHDAHNFLTRHKTGYDAVNSAIIRMYELDILVSPPPIKKQTLTEKIHMIKNFNQCLDLYNNWVSQYTDMGSLLSVDDITQQSEKEYLFWNSFSDQDADKSDPLAIETL
jgi:hypothetical protein